MMKSLYQYTNDFLAVKAELDELDLDSETYADTLEQYEADIADKAENIIKYRNELLGLAELQKEEAKNLVEAAKAKEAKAASLVKYLDETMKAIEAKELQAGVYKLDYRKGSEVVEVDEDKLPKKYFIPQPSKPMSKPELKKLLKEGKEIEGVCLKRNPDSLQIKM